VIRDFATGYHSRNGGGDLIQTDGDLPIIDVGPLAPPAALVPVPATDSRDKRPVQIVVGATSAFVRSFGFVILAIALIVASQFPDAVVDVESDTFSTETETAVALIVGGVLVAVGALVDLISGIAVLRGRNWARMLLMLYSAVAIGVAFVQNATGAQRITLQGNLLTVAISILVLLALTSHRARDFTRPIEARSGAGAPAVESSRD
jgi:uncharacterized membrane protein